MIGSRELLLACLLLLSAVAAVSAFRAAPVAGVPLNQFAIRPSEQVGGVQPRALIIVDRDGEMRTVRCESPVDNAWVNLAFRLVETKTGRSQSFDTNISYYHGTNGAEAWETGDRVTTQFVTIAERGVYQIFVKGKTGRGDDPASSIDRTGMFVDVSIYDGPQGLRTWLLILAASSVLGASVLLWTLANRRPLSAPGNERRLEETPASTQSFLRHDASEAPANGLLVSQSSNRLAMLDGMRGAAALAVVCCHFFVPEMSSIATTLNSIFPDPIPTLARHGDLGVEVFFVLSGFVIAFSIGNQRISGRFAANFALRRSIRLDPPYLTTLALSMLLWAAYLPGGLMECYERSHEWKGMLANAFYLQDVLGFPSTIGVAWTLCLEIQFYLVYICLFSLSQYLSDSWGTSGQFNRLNSDASQTALLITFLPFAVASVYWWNTNLSDFSVFGSWHRFFIGVLCYWTYSRQISSPIFTAFIVALAGLAIHSGDLRAGTAVVTALLIHLAGRTGHLSTALSGPWLQYLGRVSYSLYLVHIMVGVSLVNFLWRADQSIFITLCLLGVGLIASLIGAELMYRFFELPSVRLSRNFKGTTCDRSVSPSSCPPSPLHIGPTAESAANR